MTTEIKIPNKSLFKLDEVCSITGVKPYVLRFWESEFEQIAPLISSSGQKLFEHKDIEAIALIKNLLFERKMTIEAAKAHMEKSYVETNEMSEGETQVQEDDFDRPHISMELTSNQLENLDKAKLVLRDLISRTESVQKANNWI